VQENLTKNAREKNAGKFYSQESRDSKNIILLIVPKKEFFYYSFNPVETNWDF